MKENIQVITIRQVAEKANVSIGTVDRILHNRGRISEVTREKVLNIVKELGYKPNIHASLLSARKSIKIIVIIPYFQSEEFWSLVYEGIKKAKREHSTYKLSIDKIAEYVPDTQIGTPTFDTFPRVVKTLNYD